MTNLEELLLKITEVSTLTESQSHEALKSVLEPEVKSFVKESLMNKDNVMKEDDDMDYTEEVVDADGNAAEMDVTDTEMTDTEMPSDDMEMSDDDMEMPVSGPEDEDEVLDLTNASLEEVMEKLKDLPDDTVIEIVKNPPTYDVKPNAGLNEEEEICEECDDEMYEGYDMDEASAAAEIDEWIEEALQESANERKVNEYKAIVEQYEKKLRKMQASHTAEVKALNEQLNIQKRTNKRLSEERQKYNAALTESNQLLDQLAVHNTNLLHITKLFTEQTVNRAEKIEIAKQFDNVQTVNESKILFEALSKTLPKKAAATNVQQLKEEMKPASPSNSLHSQSASPSTLKEEKTFNDPDFERFNQLIKYKI